MPQITLTLPDALYERVQSLAQVQHRTPEELVYRHLRRELGEDAIDSQSAKELAKAFVQKGAGRCLTVSDPVLEQVGKPIWLVPVVTNVPRDDAAFVGQVVVDAQNGDVLTNEGEIVAMVKKAHPSLGFRSLPSEEQLRMSELMDRNNDGLLTEQEQDELRVLVDQSLALTITNLEQLDRRLCPED